ncbi:hypothetical protein DSO57_1010304 [Entomophthora muscae]|uniref:Uncharacterized protein n=1 Tax=Entomophthora muscae TaxID=34485 RepID=A0ACC2U4E2_9FUNG|nr:hypothetical protein DSO57_1010304 [Entomophthora muscae]
MSLASRNLHRINHAKTAFFVCDIQDRFSTEIFSYPTLITTAQKLLSAAQVLDSRVIVTEQYPKVLGSTDKKLDISRAVINQPKTLFSMVSPEVQTHLEGIESIILFGLEVLLSILFSSKIVSSQIFSLFKIKNHWLYTSFFILIPRKTFYQSHVCILQTCLDLLRHGFDVRVVVDGVSSANKTEIPTALMVSLNYGFNTCIII